MTPDQCAICLEDISVPAAVGCGHVFCLECITAHNRAQNRGGVSKCPSCRADYTRPIKLFVGDTAPSRVTPPPPRPARSFAESTLIVPFFAEVHINRLREDLGVAQSSLDDTRAKLETMAAEKRKLESDIRLVSSERDVATTVRKRMEDGLRALKQTNHMYFEAGRDLERQLEAAMRQKIELGRELGEARELAQRLEERLEFYAGIASPPQPGSTTLPADEVHSIKLTSGIEQNGTASPPVAVPGLSTPPPTLPPLPPSMTLDEILSGGMKKYALPSPRSPK